MISHHIFMSFIAFILLVNPLFLNISAFKEV